MENLNRGERKRVSKFWNTSYKYGADKGQKLPAEEIFKFFQFLNPERNITFNQFHKRSIDIGVKEWKDTHRKVFMYAVPLTEICTKHHFPSEGSHERGDRFLEFSLINIQGLLTQDHNKVQTLDKLLCSVKVRPRPPK